MLPRQHIAAAVLLACFCTTTVQAAVITLNSPQSNQPALLTATNALGSVTIDTNLWVNGTSPQVPGVLLAPQIWTLSGPINGAQTSTLTDINVVAGTDGLTFTPVTAGALHTGYTTLNGTGITSQVSVGMPVQVSPTTADSVLAMTWTGTAYPYSSMGLHAVVTATDRQGHTVTVLDASQNFAQSSAPFSFTAVVPQGLDVVRLDGTLTSLGLGFAYTGSSQGATGHNARLDGIQLALVPSPVPEASAWALMALGLAGVAGVASVRRRRGALLALPRGPRMG